MAEVVVVPKKVRVANTHNVLTRARPLVGAASVGDAATFDADGNWIKQAGVGRTWGVIIGIQSGGMPLEDGNTGDDAEVLMEGIVAGYTVAPNVVVYDGGDGTLVDTGTTDQIVGVGMCDNLLYVRPNLGADLIV